MQDSMSHDLVISDKGVELSAFLTLPTKAHGIVIFAHGSGSSRMSPRNRRVAQYLNQQGMATLLLDLLTEAEEVYDQQTARLRFDIDLLAERLLMASHWLTLHALTQKLELAYFGASTGAAAAIIAAAKEGKRIQSLVSRGGRPDLAGIYLERLTTPTLLIVGGEDTEVLALHQQAMKAIIVAPKRLEIIPGATHLFEEPGALDCVAFLAANWFNDHWQSQTISKMA